jgi:hypothetical protein
MKYAVETGSRVIIYIPSFMTTGSGIQKLTRGRTHRHVGTPTGLIWHMPNFIF